jgi:hypothetical protein
MESARTTTGEGQHERQFLDSAFDSTPIYPTVLANGVDNITPIWLDGDEWTRAAIHWLLGEARPDAPDGRVSVCACAVCGDLGCGAITVMVERGNGTVSWRDWGYQNNYEDGFVAIADLPDVTFDATQYDSVLREAGDRLSHG